MSENWLKYFGIRTSQPPRGPGYATQAVVLEDSHKCKGCPIVDLKSGVVWCMLPRCDRKVFELVLGGKP